MSRESEKPPEKQVPLKTLLIAALIVLLLLFFLGVWQGQAAIDRLCAPRVDEALAQARASSAELPVIVEEVGGMGESDLEVEVRREAWSELLGEEPRWSPTLLEPGECDEVENDLLQVCREIDARPWVRERLQSGGVCALVRQAAEELAAQPPELSGELRSYASILSNVFHVSRTLGLRRTKLLRDVLNREAELREPAALALHRWMVSRPTCADRTAIRATQLYAYSGFLLDTVGGQAYLRRRGPDVEALTAFYALVTLDRAIESGYNPEGLDPRPSLQRTRELLQAQPLVFRDEYLAVLDAMALRWEARDVPSQ